MPSENRQPPSIVLYTILMFREWLNFSGRASRPAFWWPQLALLLMGILCAILDRSNAVAIIYNVLIFIPSLSLIFRRLHDSDRSAWWILMLLLPVIGAIWLLILLCLPGTPGPNRYGPPPVAPSPEICDNIPTALGLNSLGFKNTADQLKTLKTLYDQGILTSDEYEAKRRALIEKL